MESFFFHKFACIIPITGRKHDILEWNKRRKKRNVLWNEKVTKVIENRVKKINKQQRVEISQRQNSFLHATRNICVQVHCVNKNAFARNVNMRHCEKAASSRQHTEERRKWFAVPCGSAKRKEVHFTIIVEQSNKEKLNAFNFRTTFLSFRCNNEWREKASSVKHAKPSARLLSRMLINLSGHVIYAFLKCVSLNCKRPLAHTSLVWLQPKKNFFHVEIFFCILLTPLSVNKLHLGLKHMEHGCENMFGICVVYTAQAYEKRRFAYLLCLNAVANPITHGRCVCERMCRERTSCSTPIFIFRSFTSSN